MELNAEITAATRKVGASKNWPNIANMGATRLPGFWEGSAPKVRKDTKARMTEIHQGNLLAMMTMSSRGLVRFLRAMGLCVTPEGG